MIYPLLLPIYFNFTAWTEFFPPILNFLLFLLNELKAEFNFENIWIWKWICVEIQNSGDMVDGLRFCDFFVLFFIVKADLEEDIRVLFPEIGLDTLA